MRTALSETWRRVDAEAPPEGTDSLLWELGQLRKVAPLAHAARTHNLSAIASLLRAAHGLLDLLARIEKAKGEELKAQQATANALPPAAVQEELDRWLDDLAERMRQSPAAAPKCRNAVGLAKRRFGKSPSRPGPGCIDEMGKVQGSRALTTPPNSAPGRRP